MMLNWVVVDVDDVELYFCLRISQLKVKGKVNLAWERNYKVS